MNTTYKFSTRVQSDYLHSIFLRLFIGISFLAFGLSLLSGGNLLVGLINEGRLVLTPLFIGASSTLLLCGMVAFFKPSDFEARLVTWWQGLRQPITPTHPAISQVYSTPQLIQNYRARIQEIGGFRADSRLAYHPDPLYIWLDQFHIQSRLQRWNDSFGALIAVGLMTYGRLDVIETALNGIADTTHPGELHDMARVLLFSLLPLPPALIHAGEPDKTALHQWLRDNQAKLAWDSASSRFLLYEQRAKTRVG